MASTASLGFSSNSPGPKQGILLRPYPSSAGPSPRLFHGSPPLPAVSGSKSASNSPLVRGTYVPLPRTDSDSSTNSKANPPDHPQSQIDSRTSSIRKIRFAPLPDPRALEEAELAQLESPRIGLNEDSNTPITPNSTVSQTSSSNYTAGVLGLFNPPTDDGNTDTASEVGGSLRTLSINNTSSATRAKSKVWGKRLFKPFLRTGGNREGGSISDDQLYRPTSRDSFQSSTSNESGIPLGRRRTFEGRTRHSSLGPSTGSAPLTRVQSAQNPRRQRMLNGRVYGAKPSAFQNVPPSDPDFVEWGYGGAGAVNNRHGAGISKYAGVQSSGRLAIGAIAGGDKGSTVPDDDDGSGMAWVRRRREERERQKKEQEEKEKQKAEAEATTATTPSAVSASSPKDAIELPTPDKGPSKPSAGIEPAGTPEEHHHVTAINVPAPPHVHAHGHPHIHNASTKSPEASEVSTRTSSSLDEDDEEEEEDEGITTEDDEEDDEDEAENERRKTSLGAGVEKVSRHKDQE